MRVEKRIWENLRSKVELTEVKGKVEKTVETVGEMKRDVDMWKDRVCALEQRLIDHGG